MARVVVVEPDRRLRDFIAGILAEFGHEVQPVATPGDARRWMAPGRCDVVATDLVLGAGSRRLFPWATGLPIVTLSGEPARPAPNGRGRPMRLRDKPFRVADLQHLVAAVTAASSSRRAA